MIYWLRFGFLLLMIGLCVIGWKLFVWAGPAFCIGGVFGMFVTLFGLHFGGMLTDPETGLPTYRPRQQEPTE